jgi:hypothetical protein
MSTKIMEIIDSGLEYSMDVIEALFIRALNDSHDGRVM